MKVPARNHRKDITIERAKAIVEGAPNYDRDILIAFVRDALQDAFDEGKIAGACEAREGMLRESLSIARGMSQTIEARAKTLELELRDHLAKVGKVTII